MAEIITHEMPAQLVYRLRMDHQFTQRELEKISGYCQGTINKIENIDDPRRRGGYWRTVCDLLDAMGYDVIIRKRADG